MAKAKKDLYTNRAHGLVTMSAADTITFQQINFAVGIFQGIALKLIRVLWYPDQASFSRIDADTKYFQLGLTLRDDLTSLSATNLSVVVSKIVYGLGDSPEIVQGPLVDDFSTLPGGGLLIPANPVYLGMDSNGVGSALVVRAVLYYTFVELTDKESVELLQTILPGNV